MLRENRRPDANNRGEHEWDHAARHRLTAT